MLARLAYAAFVGIIVFFIALIILGALALPTSPWAALLGVLAAIVAYSHGSRL